MSPKQITTTFRGIEEQINLVPKVIDVVDEPNTKLCVTLLLYSVDEPESSPAQGQIVARKKEEDKFRSDNYMICKLDQLIEVREMVRCVHQKVSPNQHIGIVP